MKSFFEKQKKQNLFLLEKIILVGALLLQERTVRVSDYIL